MICKFKSVFVIAICCVILFSDCTNSEPEHVSHTARTEPAHWDYTHTDWAAEGYADCGGVIQSPINIVSSKTIKAVLPDIIFNYTDFPLSIVDNGHTVQVNLHTNAGSNTITYNGIAYNLKQFHFHIASEHLVDSQQAAMELHLVHQNEQSGAYIVVGIMIEKSDTDNPFISKLWSALPAQRGREELTAISVNMNSVLPVSKLYYTYVGSLTAPPCSQGLNWLLMKEKIKMSAAQIAKFRSLYNNNARPVQGLNNRLVYEEIAMPVIIESKDTIKKAVLKK